MIPSEQRCVTCAWWHPPKQAHLFVMSSDGDEYGECLRGGGDHFSPSNNSPNPVLAFALPGGDHEYARLATKATFGCVQWEPADDSE